MKKTLISLLLLASLTSFTKIPGDKHKLVSKISSNKYPCHPAGDIGPCTHRLHYIGDQGPCTHYDIYGNRIHSYDIYPCVHRVHDYDLYPCVHICF